MRTVSRKSWILSPEFHGSKRRQLPDSQSPAAQSSGQGQPEAGEREVRVLAAARHAASARIAGRVERVVLAVGSGACVAGASGRTGVTAAAARSAGFGSGSATGFGARCAA